MAWVQLPLLRKLAPSLTENDLVQIPEVPGGEALA